MHDGRPDHRRLHGRQQQILEYIDAETRRRGYPPSVREITRAVRLKSPSTTQYHLEKLIRQGWLQRDENSPRALRVAYDWQTGARGERRATRYVPLVGDVAAGADVVAQENVEQLLPLPLDFTGEGELFMLRVRGDSLAEAGILNGDYVVARAQTTAADGDLVVVGSAGGDAAVRRFRPAADVELHGRVVTVVRRV